MKNTIPTPPQTRIKLAIFTSILASLLYTIMLSVSKVAASSCPTVQLVFIRSIISLFLTIACITYTKKNESYINYLKTKQIKTHIIRGISALSTVYLFLFAIKESSIAEVSLLFNTCPIFIPLIAYIWKKNPIDHKIWPGIIIAFIGIALLFHPEHTMPGLGLTLSVLGGALGAIAILALRFAHYSEPLYRSIFYYTLLSTIVTGILCYISDVSWDVLYTIETLIPLISVGVLGFIFQLLFAISTKYAPAKLIAPFSYISVIFGVLFDFAFWGKKLTVSESSGMILVLIGLFFVIFLLQPKKDSLKGASTVTD